MEYAAFEVWSKSAKTLLRGKICEGQAESLESVNLNSNIDVVGVNDGSINISLVHRTDETVIAERRMAL